MRLVALSLALLALAGCTESPAQPKRQFGPTITYGCSNGSQISARYSVDGEVMSLRVNGKSNTLSHVESADGAKYSNSLYTAWNKGNDLRLETVGTLLALQCRDVAKGGASQLLNITGTVSYRERIALTPQALLVVQLLDVSLADAPSVTLAEYRRENVGQVPIPFVLSYDAAKLQPGHRYAVSAQIREGAQLRFVTDTQYTVLANGPEVNPVALVLVSAGH